MYHYSPSRSQKCEFCEFWDLLAAFRENWVELACACVALRQPACSLRGLRGTALRPVSHLRATCVACVALAWNLRGLRGACVAPPACNVRGLRGTCEALLLALASNWRGTTWKKTHNKFLFFSVWNNEIVKTAENAQKNRKTIVVHTWGFCGLHCLHFVPKGLGGFAFVPQKTLQRKSSKVGAWSSTPKAHPKSESPWRIQDSGKWRTNTDSTKPPKCDGFFGLPLFFENCFVKGRRLVGFPTLKLAGLIARVGIRGEGTVIGVFANSGRHEKINDHHRTPKGQTFVRELWRSKRLSVVDHNRFAITINESLRLGCQIMSKHHEWNCFRRKLGAFCFFCPPYGHMEGQN